MTYGDFTTGVTLVSFLSNGACVSSRKLNLGNDFFRAAYLRLATRDKGLIVLLPMESKISPAGFGLVKLDVAGNVIWKSTFNIHSSLMDITESVNGNLVMVTYNGYFIGLNHNPFAMVP